MAMDPVTQTLAQQQSGTAQGEGFGQYFVQGRQQGLMQKRLALEERQVKMQETEQSMLLPLKRDLLKAQALNVGVEYKANVMKAQLMSEGNAALPEMLDLALRIQGTPDGYTREVYKEEFRGILKRNPGAGMSEVGQKLWQGFESQPMYDARFKRIEEAKKRFGTELESFDPTTGRTSFQPLGRPISQLDQPTIDRLNASAPEGMMLQSYNPSTGSVTFTKKDASAGTLSGIGKEAADLAALEAAGDPVRVQQFRQLQAQRDVRNNERVVVHPDGSMEIIKGGGASADTPAAITTAATKSLVQQQKSLMMLGDLRANIRPQDVGFAGVIGENVLDELLPQLGYNTSDVQRMTNREKLRLLKEGALRMVTTDDRFSNTDRIAVEETLPAPGVTLSYPKAITVIDTLTDVFAKRSLIDAQTLKVAAPAWAINAMTPRATIEAIEFGLLDQTGIKAAFDAGKITEEQAIQAWRKAQTPGK